MNSTRLIYFGKEYEDLYQTQFANPPRNVKVIANKTKFPCKSLRNESYFEGIKSDESPSYHKAGTKNLQKNILNVETHLQQSSMIESPEEITAGKLLASLKLSFRCLQSTSAHTTTEEKALNININYTDDERQSHTDKYLDSETASEIVDQNIIKYDDSRKVEQSNNDVSIFSSGLELDDKADDCFKRITQGIRVSIEAKLLEYERKSSSVISFYPEVIKTIHETVNGGCAIENVIDDSHRVTLPCDGQNERMQLSNPSIREFADKIIMVSDHPNESKAVNEKQRQAALGIWTSSGEYSPVQINSPSLSFISRIHKLMLSCYKSEEDTNAMKSAIHQTKEAVVASIFSPFQSSAAVDGLSASTIESNDQAFDIDHIRQINILDGNEVYDDKDGYMDESEIFDLVGKVILLQQFEDVVRGINQTKTDADSREDDRDALNARQPHLAINPDGLVELGRPDIASHTIASPAGKDYCSRHEKNYAYAKKMQMQNEQKQQGSADLPSPATRARNYQSIPCNPLPPSNYEVDNNNLALDEESIIKHINIEMTSAGYEVVSKDNSPSIPPSERLDDNPNLLNMGCLPSDDRSENARLVSNMVNDTTQVPLYYKKERRVDHYLFDEILNSSLSATQTSDKCKRDDYFTMKSFSTSSDWSFDSISLNSYPSRNSTGCIKKAANSSHSDTLSITEDNSFVSFDTDITRYFDDVTTHQIYLDHTTEDKSESDVNDKYALDLKTDL